MRILLIDTCGETGTIALADPALVATEMIPGRTASERLLPAIKDMIASSRFRLASLELLVVVHGPGSFTGVRVGLSAAKGLCEALGLPLIAISRLAVLAELVAAPSGTLVRALLSAGRGEFYSGVYADGICPRETLLTRDQILAEISAANLESPGQPRIAVACESAVAESLSSIGCKLVAEPLAGDALPLALRRIREHDFDDPATVDANYLRRTDAEIFAKPRRKAIPGRLSGTPAA